MLWLRENRGRIQRRRALRLSYLNSWTLLGGEMYTLSRRTIEAASPLKEWGKWSDRLDGEVREGESWVKGQNDDRIFLVTC